jgi:ABC-type transport system involved in multi-copper enzyme maturation permease subunit
MNIPDAIRTIRWMIRDTLRQSIATKLFWVMLAVTLVSVGVCSSVSVKGDSPTNSPLDLPAVLPPSEAAKLGEEKLKADGVRVVAGEVTLLFGTVKAPVGRNREDSVRMIELWLVAAVADTAGVLLALIWTAGFLPTFLEPQSATVLLAKPAPRWSILLGKYVGVVLFVGLFATFFIGGTWMALGLRTDIWFAAYWLAVPLLVVNFGIYYAVSSFLAVWTRSTVASAFGTLLFWLVCWLVNYTHVRLIAVPMDALTPTSMFMLDLAYWILPKPLDLGGIFYDSMQATGFSQKVPELEMIQNAGRFNPELSVLSSMGFAVGVLGLSAYEFTQTDY